jgi:hypothetical protein
MICFQWLVVLRDASFSPSPSLPRPLLLPRGGATVYRDRPTSSPPPMLSPNSQTNRILLNSAPRPSPPPPLIQLVRTNQQPSHSPSHNFTHVNAQARERNNAIREFGLNEDESNDLKIRSRRMKLLFVRCLTFCCAFDMIRFGPFKDGIEWEEPCPPDAHTRSHARCTPLSLPLSPSLSLSPPLSPPLSPSLSLSVF